MKHRQRSLRHGLRRGTLAASIGALVAAGGLSSVAWGQDQSSDDEGVADAQQDTIVVTGTRIRRDDYTSANATTVVTADDMRNLGVISVADMVNQLPANVASDTPETRTDSIFNFGASIANLRGLNTASGSRTLVLVDSQRFVASNSGGQVDMNMIPTALVGRIETVTGGASATYGADAMAGVVNVILDNNIEGIRLDLSYDTDNYGQGDNVALSLGTGFEMFDRRGKLTIGYDYSTQDAIQDCTTRDYCAVSRGLIQNGTTARAIPGQALSNAIFPDLPQYVVVEGMRNTNLPAGLDLAGGVPYTAEELNGGIPADMLDFVSRQITVTGGFFGGSTASVQSNINGAYTLSADGRNLVPYLDNLTEDQRAYVVSQGSTAYTPWGGGELEYKNTPLRGKNERHNLFTQFSYDFENGINLSSNLTFSKSTSEAEQNSQRQSNWSVGCIFPDNAFLSDEWGASPALQQLFAQRAVWYDANMDLVADPYDPVAHTGGSGACRPAPFLGTSNDPDIDLFDFPEQGGTTGFTKSVAPLVDRYQISDTKTTNLNLRASGNLFEGGSWTWDGSLGIGQSENSGQIHGQQSARRMEMALQSVWDSTANGGQGAPVCAIFSNELYTGYYADPMNPMTEGEYWSQKWRDYILASLGDEGTPAIADAFFTNMAGLEPGQQPCAPINPFGTDPGTPDGYSFAYPLLVQSSRNTQLSLDFSFSGEIYKGVGAGPFRMAAGMDFRNNESKNYADQNQYTARDFNVRYADAYSGITDTSEAFVEFDMPLLRDRIAADFLSLNLGYRSTENQTRREEGDNSVVTSKTTRNIDSWKASMVWRPVDLMMVRMTRSADTRAPSAEDLFSTTRPNLTTGAINERATPFRFDDPSTDANESLDFYEQRQNLAGGGGNSRLGEETSVTQTLGLVFTPVELLSGLSVSVDYYETHIQGGVQNVSANAVLQRCAAELGLNHFEFPANYEFCANVEFDLTAPDEDQNVVLPDLLNPDNQTGIPGVWVDLLESGQVPELGEGMPNPFYPFSNVIAATASQENAQPFTSRGIDYSISYQTQLGGGGFLSARFIASRALEQRVQTGGLFGLSQGNVSVRNVAGQTGSNGVGSSNSAGWLAPLFENYSPTPKFSGNMYLTYQKNAFSITSQVRYVGRGKLSLQREWYGPDDVAHGFDRAIPPNPITATWAPGLSQTVSTNDLPSWATLNLNFSYDFSRSHFSFDKFESLSAYLNITNVGNREPTFFSGSGSGGINTTFFSGTGRTYRLGVRMQF